MTGSAGGAGSCVRGNKRASQTRGGGAGGGDWVGFQVGTGGAEALLNNETLLNESLWNLIKTTKAQWNL